MKNKKIIFAIFSISLIVFLGIGSYFSNSDRTYSASDILKDIDFSVEQKSIELKNIQGETIILELTDKAQQELINAFEKSKFKKNDNTILLSADFIMTITLNRGYFTFIDMNNKGIVVDEDGSFVQYLFEDDKGFFNILNNVVAE